MMRNVSAVLVTAALAGCAGGTNLQPVNLTGPAPDATAVAMECVTRELENLGYETTENQSTPTRVTGIRVNEKPWFVQWLYGNTADQITAAIEGGELRVTAASSDPNGLGDEAPPTSGASDVASRNAQTVLDTCSEES